VEGLPSGERGESNVIDVSGDPTWGEVLADQSTTEPDVRESEPVQSAGLSPWFLIGILAVQVAWLGSLAYLLVRVV
jgi:hypothetical protein